MPDLIVTVLNPSRWTRMVRLDCYRKDEPGIVADVIRKIPPLNIALAETVKLEKDDLHRISLICEPIYDGQDTSEEITRITEELKTEGFKIDKRPLPELPELAWNRTGTVEHGWVKGVKWLAEISRNYPATVDKADLTKVVASADTESRVLRFVFPRRGAVTVSIKHADEPGALAEITSTLRSCNLNILSAFLRRGGGGGLDAELVAVCEPINDINEDSIGTLKGHIENSIMSIPQRFRPQLSISEGKYAEDTIYSRHPEEIVARVPRNLSWSVRDLKDRLKGEAASNKIIPIFLSRRFSEGAQGSRIVEDVRQALLDNGCIPVEAESGIAREPITIYFEVSSKMWVSTAGIVLVIKDPDSKHISINLAHELGFLLGQGKKVLMLVEDVQECIEVMNSFANIAGVLFQRFDPMLAKDKPESAYSKVREWIRVVKEGA
ncbi:MAG: hypothetical protein M3348_07060 [Acidobacteriota bacterium]|nr:hypothetical protein [Acidobacteriota bacterium]